MMAIRRTLNNYTIEARAMPGAHLCAADAGEILPEVLLQHVISDIRRQVAHEDRMVGGCVGRTQKSVDRGSWTTTLQLTKRRKSAAGMEGRGSKRHAVQQYNRWHRNLRAHHRRCLCRRRMLPSSA